jgi:hypothetical protein
MGTPNTYTFGQQIAAGQAGEAILDGWLELEYEVTEATREEQRRGIDRWAKKGNKTIGVEYKTDFRGHTSGFGFVETISVDKAGKQGWLWTTEADWVVYWTPGNQTGIVLSPEILRQNAYQWTKKYNVKTASNPSYHSYGILVPLEELQRVAIKVFTWPNKNGTNGLGQKKKS